VSNNRGKRYTKGEREELLQLFEQSEYSASRFCQEMGVCYATLKRWLGRESPRVNLIEVTAAASSNAVPLRVRLVCVTDSAPPNRYSINLVSLNEHISLATIGRGDYDSVDAS